LRAEFVPPGGLLLEEIAPGIELQRDVLYRMAVQPVMDASPRIMSPEFLTAPA